MVEKVILLDFDGSTARVTPNRPEVHNALSMEMSDMLVEAIQTVERSTAVSFLAIEGAGNTFLGRRRHHRDGETRWPTRTREPV